MRVSRRSFIGASAATLLTANTALSSAQAQTPAKRFKACIIGDTRQGGYGHSLHMVWAFRDDVEVAAVADPDEAGRLKNAEEAKAQRTYADYREMLEKEKPNLVSIAPRWTIHHREYLLAAAAAGAHGIMEKPMAPDLAEADEMIRAIEDKNLKWGIAFNFRVDPIIPHVKRLIFEQGIIGDLLEVRARGKEDARAGGEDLLVLGTHNFDLMRHFLGNPLWCESDITVEGAPAGKQNVREATEPLGPIVGDKIHAMFGFPGGVIGHFASVRNQDGNKGRWGLDFHGSKGVVSLRLDGAIKAFIMNEPSWTPSGKESSWIPLPNTPPNVLEDPVRQRYAPIIAGVIDAIDQNVRPPVSLQDGRDSLEMIQAVYAAYVKGGRVAFPLQQREHPLKNWA